MRSTRHWVAVCSYGALFLGGCAFDAGTQDDGAREPGLGEAMQPVVTCTTLVRGGPGVVEDSSVAYDPTDPSRANLNLGALPLVQAAVVATQTRLGLVKFDLSSIPAGASITNAMLSLVKQGSTGPGAVSVYEVAGGGWSEGSVTYNNFGGVGALAGSFVPAAIPSGGAATVDLTATVASWYSGSLPNNGVALSMTQARSAFRSSEDIDPTIRPMLTVCYDQPTCSDGIQNGGEAGVDCGGPCAPCSFWPILVGAAPSPLPPWGTSIRDLAVGPGGDIYITGLNGSSVVDYGGGAHALINPGGTEAYVARYDATGAFQSLGATFAAPGNMSGAFDTGDGIAVDAAGNAFMRAAASTYSYFYTGTYVEKFDPAGNSFGRLGSSGIVTSCGSTSTCITDNFGFSATGIQLDAGGNLTMNASFVNGPEIAQYTSAGTALWSGSAAGSGSTVFGGIAIDGAGNRFITGRFLGTLQGPGGLVTAPSSTWYSTFVMKVNAAGSVQWVRAYGGADWTQGTAIAADAAGNIWLSGLLVNVSGSTGTLVLGPYTFPGVGSSDAFLAKLDPAGNVVWAESYFGAGGDNVTDLAVDSLGQLQFVGQTSSTGLDLGGGPLPTTGTFRGILDSNGNHVASAIVPGSIVSATNNFGPQVAIMPTGDAAVSYVDVSGRSAITVLP